MKQLKINPEFANLLPPLTDEEYSGLEADIIANGCRDALTIWNGTIVDGHNRYKICHEKGIEFETVEMEFESVDDAKWWIGTNQIGRRNLTNYGRAELAIEMKPLAEARAKKRQGQRTDLKTDNIPAKMPECSGDARDELAKIAGISPRSMSKVEFIAEHADEETKEKLRRKEKGVSISGVYNDLKSKETKDTEVEEKSKAEDAPSVQIEEKKPVEAPNAKEPVPVDNEPTVQEETVNPYAERIKEIVYGDVEKYHYDCVNLMNIPKYQTVQLRNCLFKLFTTDYRVDLIVALIEEMVDVDGKEVVSNLMKTLKKKFK